MVPAATYEDAPTVSDATAKKYRVAYLVTHPIQYQAPLLRFINADPDIYLKAFFASDFSARAFVDPEFGRTIEWDVALLEGYEYEVLPALPGTRYPGDSHFDAWRPFSTGLRRRLRAGRFDALWIHGYARLPHLWAMLVAKSAGVKVLVRDETNGVGRAAGGFKAHVKQGALATIDLMVDAWLTVGRLNEHYLQSLGIRRDKLVRVAHAVDNAWFQARISEAGVRRQALRSELDLAPGVPIVLFAAKLIARKAPLHPVEAFGRLLQGHDAGPRPVLLMAGDGDLRAAVEARIAALGLCGAVKVLGFQSQQRLAALYELCDVFLLPSAHENWGLAVNEAMNAGKPVIASDRVVAACDLIEDGVNGFVYPFGDIDALVAQLRQAIADPVRLAAMGALSRRIIDGWGFAQNLAGLKSALALTVG